MEAHELADLFEARRQANQRYLEFLRVTTLSAGIYEIPAGGRDTQSPQSIILSPLTGSLDPVGRCP